MQLTNPERLILVMLAEIHEKLGIQKGIDTKLLAKSIHTNNTWALSCELPGIIAEDSPDTTPPQVTEVSKILAMWRSIEEAYQSFRPTDKAKIKTEASPFGEHVQFTGFDGNNESKHMGIARFLIEQMDSFSHFTGRNLNSHCPVLDEYRRMLTAYEPMQGTLVGHGLNADQVIEILNAKRA